MAGITAREMG